MKSLTILNLLFCHLISFANNEIFLDSIKWKNRFNSIPVLPAVGYNDNDKFMLGLNIRQVDSTKKFNFYGYNFYSLKGHVAGYGEFLYKIPIENSFIESIIPTIQYQRFSHSHNEMLDYNLLYNRISTLLKITLKTNNENVVKSIVLKSSFIGEDFAFFSSANNYKLLYFHSNLNRVGYYYNKHSGLYDSRFWTELDFFNYETILNDSRQFLKLTSSYSYEWTVSDKSNIGLRIWGSYFLINDQRQSNNYSDIFTKGSASLIYQGHNDYAYEHLFLSRNNGEGAFRNQFNNHGGGFKTPHTLTSNIGQSNHLTLALNTFIQAPFSVLKLKPIIFADLGSYSQYSNNKYKNKYLYSIGIGLTSNKNNMGIFLPLINSSDISNNYNNINYNLLERFSFHLTLNPYY